MAGFFAASFSQMAAAEPVEVVTLGDSLTAGYGLAPQDGFAAQLQTWLDANGYDARLVNASVSGDTTAGGAARLDWVLQETTDAVIVQLGANDFLRGLDPGQARGNLTKIMEEISARGLPVLLVGLPAPGNYGADYKADFDSIYPDLAEAYGAILYADLFAPLRELGLERMDEVMQSDGLHPNAAGVARVVEGIGPAVGALITTSASSSSAQANPE